MAAVVLIGFSVSALTARGLVAEPTHEIGAQGPKGETGAVGPVGPQGIPGPPTINAEISNQVAVDHKTLLAIAREKRYCDDSEKSHQLVADFIRLSQSATEGFRKGMVAYPHGSFYDIVNLGTTSSSLQQIAYDDLGEQLDLSMQPKEGAPIRVDPPDLSSIESPSIRDGYIRTYNRANDVQITVKKLQQDLDALCMQSKFDVMEAYKALTGKQLTK